MRRTLTVVGLLLALLGLAAFAAWLARIPLATAWLDGALERRGYPEARFEITRIGWGNAVVEDVAAGPSAGPSIDRVEAAYAPLSLLLGDLRHVRVTAVGLRMELDPWGEAGGGATSGGATGARPTPGDIAGALAGLPNLRLEGARVRVLSPYGTWRVEADGRLGPGDDGLQGDLTATASNQRLRVDARLDARLRGARLDAELSAREDDGAMIRVGARSEGAWYNPRIELDVESELPSGADLPWALLPGPAPAAGDLLLAGTATGHLDTGSWPTGASDLVARVAAGEWSGDWRVRGRDLALSHRLADVEVDARGRIASREGALALIADEDQGATIGTIEDSLRATLPVPAAAGRYVSGPLAVSWPGGEVLRLIPSEDERRGVALSGSPVLAVTWPGQPGRLSLQAGVEARVGGAGPLVRGLSLADVAIEARGIETGDARIERLQLTGDLHELARGPRGHLRLVLDAPRIALAGLALEALEAEASLDLAPGEEGTEVVFAEGGALRVAAWRAGERVRAAGRGVVATLEGGGMQLGDGVDWRLDLAVEPFAAQLRAGARARRLEIEPGRVRVAYDASGLQLETRDTRVAHAGDPAWFAPAVVTARVERNPGGYSISGEGRLGAPGVPFTLSGGAAPAAGAASLRVAVPSVRFRPGGPQPGALVPALDRIRAATGRAGGSLRVQVRPQGVDGTARLTLEGVSFRTRRVRVAGLAGTLALDGLRPPRANGEQALRAASIEAGVPVTDARLRFGLVRPPGGGTALAIADASGVVLGGRARIRDWTFEPGAQVHTFTVELDGVELARVLEHLGVDGLEGRGALSGRLPVTVADGGVAVRGGRIRGRAGRLALRSPRAVEVLVDSGLVDGPTLEALRDFDYASLALGIDRTLAGTTTMRIRLEGSNPAVRDGERLDFDVLLTGDIGPLATALAEGRPLTSDLIERSLDLRPTDAAE